MMDFELPERNLDGLLPPIPGLEHLGPTDRREIEAVYGEVWDAWMNHYSGNCCGCARCDHPPTRAGIAKAYLARREPT